MPEPLPVHVGRSERHAIETVESFETAGPFVVEITNHGRDAHVHLRLDEGLAGAARIDGDDNVYVENGETRRVRIETAPDGGVTTGTLTVETGFGAEGVGVDVTVGRPDEAPAAEASVGTTAGTDPEPVDPAAGAAAPSVPDGTLPIVGLALVALGIAALTALTLESPVVIAGVFVVLVAVVAAGALLIR
ncbi:hypothetical protein BRD00_05040 [Halobacteriales archaeon QS_8_69_26]|nr:MAG: hypothetical protein BRD00_05040 [Halobacteriales archaeon QS_8_69_26]